MEIVLTREDANSESAFLAEWSVEDGATVKKGQVVCVVETSKASIEIEAPGDGTLVHLAKAETEVELGSTIAVVAANDEEVQAAEARRSGVRQEAAAAGPANVTRRAAELAAQHGIDLSAIAKSGFVTTADVEALVRAKESSGGGGGELQLDPLLAGLSTENVTLPARFGRKDDEGKLDKGFFEQLIADPGAFAAQSSEEKVAAYRAAGAVIGEGVELGKDTAVVAPRIILEDGARIDDAGRVVCAEVFAMGALSRFGHSLNLTARRAWIGSGLWAGTKIVIGGGGNRDPWATFAVGDDAFIGDEVFINVARPALLGAETFTTMRSMLVTHNIGHSILEGFENRFAGIVVEDRGQIGLGAVVYAGCRVGREAIVASNSYVVSDVPAGMLAVGVPAKVAGPANRQLPKQRQAQLARKMLQELHETLVLRGSEVEAIEDGIAVKDAGRVLFIESFTGDVKAGEGETVVLTLGVTGEPPQGVAVLDLLGRQVHGTTEGPLVDSVREFCRKRGIRFAPGPWRYTGGLV
jgi:carbonic anhydrase/acetyltransferase-like protein (isoleucine patch superfamily)